MNAVRFYRQHRRFRPFIAVFAGTVWVLASALPASAAPTPSGGSDAIPVASTPAYEVHSTSAPVRETVSQFLHKAARDGVTVPAGEVAQLTLSAATISCWYYTDWRAENAALGNRLWTFYVQPNWCGDGSWIRSQAYTNVWASTPGLGWVYNGLIASATHDYGGVNWNYFESIREGSFCWVSTLGCIQSFYPYIDVEVGPGGQVYKH